MSKYNYNYAENDYKTPLELYEKALNWYFSGKSEIDFPKRFGLDVCCSEKNIPALFHYIKGEADGLKEPWHLWNWCNPPFNECKLWVKKAHEEQLKGKTTAMLIPARTETAYWHEYILNQPDVEIEFLKKGYRFLDKNNNNMGIFKNALALVYFRGARK